MKIARKANTNNYFRVLSINKAKKIRSFYDFCSSIYSHYYSWNWIVSSISRAHCDVISPLCAKMNYFRKNIVNFYGKLTLVYLISRVFLALDSQNFLAHCALLKTVTSVRGKELFLLQIIHIFAHSDSKIFCEASQNRLELLFLLLLAKLIYILLFINFLYLFFSRCTFRRCKDHKHQP